MREKLTPLKIIEIILIPLIVTIVGRYIFVTFITSSDNNDEQIKETLLLLIENQKRIYTELGIESQIDFDIEKEIPPEVLQQLTEQSEKIRKLQSKLQNDDESIDSNFLLKESVVYYYAGEYGKMLAISETVTLLEPDNPDGWYNRGIALAALERHEEALERFEKAIEIDPDNKRLWNNRGSSLIQLGSLEEAMESFEKSLQIDPNFEDVKKGIELIKSKLRES